ncbi:hypothetical protein, partial [Achromobacter phage kwar_LB4]
ERLAIDGDPSPRPLHALQRGGLAALVISTRLDFQVLRRFEQGRNHVVRSPDFEAEALGVCNEVSLTDIRVGVLNSRTVLNDEVHTLLLGRFRRLGLGGLLQRRDFSLGSFQFLGQLLDLGIGRVLQVLAGLFDLGQLSHRFVALGHEGFDVDFLAEVIDLHTERLTHETGIGGKRVAQQVSEVGVLVMGIDGFHVGSLCGRHRDDTIGHVNAFANLDNAHSRLACHGQLVNTHRTFDVSEGDGRCGTTNSHATRTTGVVAVGLVDGILLVQQGFVCRIGSRPDHQPVLVDAGADAAHRVRAGQFLHQVHGRPALVQERLADVQFQGTDLLGRGQLGRIVVAVVGLFFQVQIAPGRDGNLGTALVGVGVEQVRVDDDAGLVEGIQFGGVHGLVGVEDFRDDRVGKAYGRHVYAPNGLNVDAVAVGFGRGTLEPIGVSAVPFHALRIGELGELLVADTASLLAPATAAAGTLACNYNAMTLVTCLPSTCSTRKRLAMTGASSSGAVLMSEAMRCATLVTRCSFSEAFSALIVASYSVFCLSNLAVHDLSRASTSPFLRWVSSAPFSILAVSSSTLAVSSCTFFSAFERCSSAIPFFWVR